MCDIARSAKTSTVACAINASATPGLNDAVVTAAATARVSPIRNELLCFVQQKYAVLAADQSVKICSDL